MATSFSATELLSFEQFVVTLLKQDLDRPTPFNATFIHIQGWHGSRNQFFSSGSAIPCTRLISDFLADEANIVFLPYAYTSGGQYESTLAVADIQDLENLTVFGETFSNPDFSLATGVNCPLMAVLNSAGKGSLRILANHDFDLEF